ncbi:hypothetical protein [Aequorivita capsosiphonis]|nr:hypothetical protein [Aequorivita capsosiphonis]
MRQGRLKIGLLLHPDSYREAKIKNLWEVWNCWGEYLILIFEEMFFGNYL